MYEVDVPDNEDSILLLKLCALLDRIDTEDNIDLVALRFDIFAEHGEVVWGPEISGYTH